MKSMAKIMKLMDFRHDFYHNNPMLGATHLHLLEHIGICEVKGVPIMVSEAMKTRTIASPATIHRHLEELFNSGYIEKKSIEDNRTKYLFMTAKARIYFKRLERIMESA